MAYSYLMRIHGHHESKRKEGESRTSPEGHEAKSKTGRLQQNRKRSQTHAPEVIPSPIEWKARAERKVRRTKQEVVRIEITQPRTAGTTGERTNATINKKRDEGIQSMREPLENNEIKRE